LLHRGEELEEASLDAGDAPQSPGAIEELLEKHRFETLGWRQRLS
jgi:hypothetical protein